MDKLFYTFKELSDKLNIDVDELRKWESEFGLTPTQTGHRAMKRFSIKEVDKLEYIRYLIIDRGYSVDKTKVILQNGIDERKQNAQMIENLHKIRSFLVNLKDSL